MDPSFGKTSSMVGGPFVASQMQNAQPGLPMQGPQAPGFTPNTQAAPLPGSLPNRSIMPQQMAPMPQPQSQPLPKSEHELIIEALANHLKNTDHIEQMRHEILQHQIGMGKNETPQK